MGIYTYTYTHIHKCIAVHVYTRFEQYMKFIKAGIEVHVHHDKRLVPASPFTCLTDSQHDSLDV